MKIGIDFGGVVANHLPVKIELAKSMFGHEIASLKDSTRRALMPVLGEERYEQLAHETGSKLLSFPPMPGLKETLTALTDIGDSFHIVSTQINATQEMLEEYVRLNQLPIASVTVIPSDDGKLPACQALGIELFIDDSVGVLESLRPMNIPLFLAVFSGDHPSSVPDGMTEITSWEEFGQEIRPNL